MDGAGLGFVDGVASVFRGLRFLVRTRRSWPFAAVPIALLVGLFVVGAFVALRYVAPAVLPDWQPGSALARFGAVTLRVVVDVLFVVAAGLVAVWLAPSLSGPALERIVLLREQELGVPARPPVPFFTELWCGLRAQLLGLVIGGPALFVLWTLTLVAPPLAVVTVPAKLVTVTFLVAWNLLDYPLSLRGLPLRERLALLRGGAPAVLGFGVAITVVFAVPFGAVVLLPAGVAGAAEIAAKLERRGA